MQKTQHYGLSLWDLGDRIKMEDFNSDNAKLDAALAALASTPTVETFANFYGSTPTASPSVPIIYRGNWDDWSFVAAYGGVTDLPSGATAYAELEAQGTGNSGHVLTPKFSGGDFLFLLLPFHDSSRNVEGFFICSGQFQHFELDIPFSQLNYFGAGAKNAGGTTVKTLVTHLKSFAVR